MAIFENIKKALDLSLQSYIAKARKTLDTKEEYVIERKSISGLEKHEDNEAGYKERASSVTFDILRQMAMRDSIVSAIIMTRVNQIKSFARLQPTKYDVGFKIVLRDKDATPTDEEKETMKDLENWILSTGNHEGRPDNTKMFFMDFLGMLTRDVLIYDQVGIETIAAKDGTLAYFVPAASGSLRWASKNLAKQKDIIAGSSSSNQFYDEKDRQHEEEILKNDAKKDENYKLVQIHQGQIIRGFFDDEMILAMLNPVTDLEANGYSVGPLELLANIVSYHLFAEAHNRLFFIQGFASRGILHIQGDIPSHHLEAFRRQWREQLSGTQNSWRTPILAGGEKINWIPLQATNRDMEWSAWTEYLIKLICALYSIAPQEINFDITKSQGPSLSDSGAKHDSVLTDSRIRGLWPLLKFFECIMNEKLLHRYNPQLYEKYEFIFCGLDVESKKNELDRIEKETITYKTINEVRAEFDLDPIDGGDIIRDSNYIQMLMNNTTIDQPDGAQSDPAIDELSSFDSANSSGSTDNQSIDSITKSLVKNMKFTKPQLMKVEYWKK